MYAYYSKRRIIYLAREIYIIKYEKYFYRKFDPTRNEERQERGGRAERKKDMRNSNLRNIRRYSSEATSGEKCKFQSVVLSRTNSNVANVPPQLDYIHV